MLGKGIFAFKEQIGENGVVNERWHFDLQHEGETLRLGRALGQNCGEALVLGLAGDLGVGKTSLARGIIQGSLHDEHLSVHSPSFTYINTYSGHCLIHHLDLYRIASLAQFSALGGFSVFTPDAVVIIEWPELIPEVLRLVDVELHLLFRNDGRSVEIGQKQNSLGAVAFMQAMPKIRESLGF